MHLSVEFMTPLVTETLGKREWRLVAPLRAAYAGERQGEIEVPAGFVTDLASVPRLPGAYLLFGGRARRSAVLHDWLYCRPAVARSFADALFMAAMRAEGESWFTRTLMFIGVRLGGGFVRGRGCG